MNTKKFNLLVIDKDRSAWESIKAHLQAKGYNLCFTDDYDDSLAQLERDNIDLVLLDDQVRGVDYLELIKQLKSQYVVPVIVVGAANDEFARITGIEIGADDFLQKPFKLEELSARIKATLRLVKQVTEKVTIENESPEVKRIEFGRWILDLERHELRDSHGIQLDLTPGEMEMLTALVKSPRQALSREQLFIDTRGRDHNGFDRSVDVQISRLRQKLESDDQRGSLIRTVRGIGYMLDADTQQFSQ